MILISSRSIFKTTLILHSSTYFACIEHHSDKLLKYWLVLVEMIIGCRARQDDLQDPYINKLRYPSMFLGGSTGERTRLALNIGKGVVLAYTWRTVNLLARLVPTYIRWPHSAEHPVQSGHRVFSRCIGFQDGTNIVLRNKPIIDPEAYFSRKKNYGFNLQAICDWEGRFILCHVICFLRSSHLSMLPSALTQILTIPYATVLRRHCCMRVSPNSEFSSVFPVALKAGFLDVAPTD